MWEIILVCAALAGPGCVIDDPLAGEDWRILSTEKQCEQWGRAAALTLQEDIGYPVDYRCVFREDLKPPIDYIPQRVE